MAKINTLQPAVTTMQGRFKAQDKVYFQKRWSECYGVRMDNPYHGPATEEQRAVREKFQTVTARVNQLSTEEPELYAELRRKFSRQRTYKTLRGFCFAYCWAHPADEEDGE